MVRTCFRSCVPHSRNVPSLPHVMYLSTCRRAVVAHQQGRQSHGCKGACEQALTKRTKLSQNWADSQNSQNLVATRGSRVMRRAMATPADTATDWMNPATSRPYRWAVQQALHLRHRQEIRWEAGRPCDHQAHIWAWGAELQPASSTAVDGRTKQSATNHCARQHQPTTPAPPTALLLARPQSLMEAFLRKAHCCPSRGCAPPGPLSAHPQQ